MIRLPLDSPSRPTRFRPFFFSLHPVFLYPPCEISFLDPLTKMTVYSCHKTGISLADIKLKGPLPPFFLYRFLVARETYRRDRFLAYNILSLVANREETKRAHGLAHSALSAAALSGRFYVSFFAVLSPFPSSFFSVFRRMIARPDAFYGALTLRCRRRCYVRSTPRKSGSTDARLYAP